MTLSLSTVSGIQVAAPTGRIDHASADAFLAALEPLLAVCKAGQPALLLDLSRVEYISSVGLRALILAFRRTGGQGGKFAVAGMQPLVQEVFTIARLNLIMPCYVDIDAACANLA